MEELCSKLKDIQNKQKGLFYTFCSHVSNFLIKKTPKLAIKDVLIFYNIQRKNRFRKNLMALSLQSELSPPLQRTRWKCKQHHGYCIEENLFLKWLHNTPILICLFEPDCCESV